ncbi:membrane protein [Fulvitalea axinellae]|uniref:Membrane protein n=1 Tax=Fulvitalea axinellae TaxID=1182444 RepID=A0AAU9D7D5_9BACT|nr:membrane protein [Fulvitalea axinellae]
MKKIKLLLLVVASVSVFGCSDWLQIEPENNITKESFWQSKEDVEASVNTIFVEMRKSVNKVFIWGELRADMLAGGEGLEAGDSQDIMDLRILDTNTHLKWGEMYRMINYANTVLKYAPGARDIDFSFTKEELDGYLAEAYFARALGYFYLLRTFHEVPLILEPSDSDNVEFHIPKSKETEILNRIIEDLKLAERTAKSDFGSLALNKGRGSRAAIQALLADVYLWSERYDDCIVMCDKIIGRSVHTLMSQSLWMDNFIKGNLSESIFELQFESRFGQLNAGIDAFLYNKGTPYFIADESVQDFYPEGDIRGAGATYREEDMFVWKFLAQTKDDVENVRIPDANWVIYRYADILLMKAEALVQKQQYLKAQELLLQVVKRAEGESTLLPTDRFLAEDVILKERAREFAFEGKRWFDILRLAKRNNYERKDVLIKLLASQAPSAERSLWESKLSDPMSYYLPIHIDELRANSKLVQNPYYDY